MKFFRYISFALFLLMPALLPFSGAQAEVASSHLYHNHMPNFWAYYDTAKYSTTKTGDPIRYTYDGQVIQLKNNPPADYPYFLPGGKIPMPHDNLVQYYSHHAKTGAYLKWPWETAQYINNNYPSGQVQVTMSASVINNVQSFAELNQAGVNLGLPADYNNLSWGKPWQDNYNTLKTPSGKRTLDLVHFSGHHTMGPLVGNDYLLKDMIFHNVTLAQPYFLGNSFKSSNGFFPTELGFSERIIPALKKLGVKWSVIGNNHFSRTLKDYPLLNDPGADTLVSPPNRASLQNVSNVGEWTSKKMTNEQQVVWNKYPFASTPHWVQYVDPDSGESQKIVGIPVAQAESWEEGYLCKVKVSDFLKYDGLVPQKQFVVIAHDGDNSQGCAGDGQTWLNSGRVTYADAGVKGMGIDEYLVDNTPANDDLVHVQDGSWIDTRDSSSDPQWHHWKLPFGIWKSQFADFNKATGLSIAPKKNINGIDDGMTVSLEYGYHYLERNFALLQAAHNYAKTAEQIWLDDHPNHWQPTTALDKEVTFSGNQLNPWMMSFPVKGDAANDYKGGANPAELSWYFLLPAIDSGFGYYDENVDDGVKPTLSFNNSLYFSKPYVTQKIASDKTGPSVWWPQRWPYNPGSANADKSSGWTTHYYDPTFAIYTYAFDVNNVQSMKVKVRKHTGKSIDAKDNTFKVYDPKALKNKGVANIDPTKVEDWVEFPMTKRDLKPDINGVSWQASGQQMMQIVKAQEIGDLYFTYLRNYRDVYLDYYIEAVDSKGNITKTDIQQVYVGMGKFSKDASGKIVEDANGSITGTYPFVTDAPPADDLEPPTVPTGVKINGTPSKTSIPLIWNASTDNYRIGGYEVYRNGVKLATTKTNTYVDTGLSPLTAYTYTVKAYDANGNLSAESTAASLSTTDKDPKVTIYYKQGYPKPYIHWKPDGGTWTTVPGTLMTASEFAGYSVANLDPGTAAGITAVFNNGGALWDNNSGKDYQFPLGVSTFEAGVIKSGAPGVIGPDTTAPTIPGNLAIAGRTTSTISLSWSAATDNVGIKAYDIYRGVTKIGSVNSLTTSYTDTSLLLDSSYDYRLKALDEAGNESDFSVLLTVKTLAQDDTTPPSAPTAVELNGVATSDSIPLKWQAATDNVQVTGYEVAVNGVKVDTVTKLSYTATGLKAGTAYLFTVVAIDSSGNRSTASTAVELQTANITGLKVHFKKPTSWNSVSLYYYATLPATVPAVTWQTAPAMVAEGGDWFVYTITGATTATVMFKDNAGNQIPGAGQAGYTRDKEGWFDGTKWSDTNPNNPQIDTTAPSIPSGLTSSEVMSNSLRLTWTASTDNSAVTGYDVYRNQVKIASVTTNNFIDSGLTASTAYAYQVTALDAAGNASQRSNSLTITTSAEVDKQAPSAPSNVQVAEVTANSFKVMWSAASDNVAVAKYEVYLNGVLKGTTSELFMQVSALSAETEYKMTVFAFDGADNKSLSSTEISAKTAAQTELIPPTVPESLAISEIGTSQFKLTWTASSDNTGVAGYEVYLDGMLVNVSSETNYMFTALADFTTYNVSLKAFDVSGNRSAESATVTAKTKDGTPPTAPSNLTVQSKTTHSILLKWAASSDNSGQVQYEIYDGTSLVATVTDFIYAMDGLTPGSSHDVSVIAMDGAGNKSQAISLVGVVVTTVPQVTNVEVSNISFSTAQISWTSANEALIRDYLVYLNGESIATTQEKTYLLSNLEEGKSYAVKIISRDELGNVAADGMARTFTTPSTKAPINIVFSFTNGVAKLSWSDSSGAKTYKIFVNEVPLTTTGTSKTAILNVANWIKGTPYNIRMVSVYSDRESAKSPIVKAVVPKDKISVIGKKVYLNGKLMSGVEANMLAGGRVGLPVRAMFSPFGVTSKWYPATKSVIASKTNFKLTLVLNSNKATLNGKTVTLDTAPAMINGSVYVPLRFVADTLGVTVEYRNK